MIYLSLVWESMHFKFSHIVKTSVSCFSWLVHFFYFDSVKSPPNQDMLLLLALHQSFYFPILPPGTEHKQFFLVFSYLFRENYLIVINCIGRYPWVSLRILLFIVPRKSWTSHAQEACEGRKKKLFHTASSTRMLSSINNGLNVSCMNLHLTRYPTVTGSSKTSV